MAAAPRLYPYSHALVGPMLNLALNSVLSFKEKELNFGRGNTADFVLTIPRVCDAGSHHTRLT